jgi:ESCRT-II complex subunit VPS36
VQAGFLKSSSKITLIPKPPKRSSIQNRSVSGRNAPSRSATSSPAARSETPFHLPPEPTSASSATWVCPICTFSNPVPSNFDPSTASAHTPLPPCLACGIKPPLAHVLKAAIAGATNRAPSAPTPIRTPMPIRSRIDNTRPLSEIRGSEGIGPSHSDSLGILAASFQCPRCTFLNHPSLLSCELCGAPLISQDIPAGLSQPEFRPESPGPVLQGSGPSSSGLNVSENVKISFRGGGEKIFHERLKGAMTQRKWLLQGAPPVPKPNRDGSSNESLSLTNDRSKTVGIAGLEQRRIDARKNNEVVIGNAFEDLEALMASAKEIVALAESFARQTNGGTSSGSSEANSLLAQSASALGLVTTKDMLASGSSSETLYLTELSRNLAEFLTDDATGVLRKAGGVMSLVDLWAIFNRARGGVELVSPMDFEKAARLWEKLRLPVRLRQFKSGVLVVQASDRTDEKTIKALLNWLKDLHSFPPEKEVPWDWQEFGIGVTARDAAARFGWSIGVAAEELEMAEERGFVCREEGIEGLKFWENWIMSL